jgi:hypothetical protein
MIVPFFTTAEGPSARFSSTGAARAAVTAVKATRIDRMRIDVIGRGRGGR